MYLLTISPCVDELLDVIGTGATGTVWRSIDRVSRVQVALKVYVNDELGEMRSQQVMDVVHALNSGCGTGVKFVNFSSTVFLLLKTDCLSFIRLFARCIDRFRSKHRWCLAFELCGMSLKSVLETPFLLPLRHRQVRPIALQIVWAVECR